MDETERLIEDELYRSAAELIKKRFSSGWLRKRLRIYRNPDSIRRKYHQPTASAMARCAKR